MSSDFIPFFATESSANSSIPDNILKQYKKDVAELILVLVLYSETVGDIYNPILEVSRIQESLGVGILSHAVIRFKSCVTRVLYDVGQVTKMSCFGFFLLSTARKMSAP